MFKARVHKIPWVLVKEEDNSHLLLVHAKLNVWYTAQIKHVGTRVRQKKAQRVSSCDVLLYCVEQDAAVK